MRKPFFASPEFWLGVATALIGLILLASLVLRVTG